MLPLGIIMFFVFSMKFSTKEEFIFALSDKILIWSSVDFRRGFFKFEKKDFRYAAQKEI